ncbi:hypothetical protein P3644_25710, partial [Vibrio parahaemolyticus]|nr:hypothetical protein [Vibrio parahaemolyticus]
SVIIRAPRWAAVNINTMGAATFVVVPAIFIGLLTFVTVLNSNSNHRALFFLWKTLDEVINGRLKAATEKFIA